MKKEIKVLDKGIVRLVDYMGSDEAIVQAARVSYGDGTKTVNEDRGLIRYLMRHQHTTPFEMAVVKLHLKMPMFIARQWHRHRTASINEISGRYSVMRDEFYIPEISRLRMQSTNNKQGSSDDIINDAHQVQMSMTDEQIEMYANYGSYQDSGLAREVARINLPNSLYTEFYWQMNLHNLFHFLKLRMDPHAQEEIRDYANAIYEIIKPLFPHACEAFEDYILNGEKLSSTEITVIKSLLSEQLGEVESLDAILNSHFKNKREREEFLKKFK